MKQKLIIALSLLFFVYSFNAYSQSEETDNADANAARLQVRISELEEQIRRLQGTIEQVSYQNKQLKSQVEKSNGDIEFRLAEIEKKSSAPNLASNNPEKSKNSAPDSSKLQPVGSNPNTENDSENVEASPVNAPAKKFAKPLDNYNYAFDLIREKKYSESADYFSAFTKSYPKDPLIGNAYYWLGETYYVRRDYIKAADNFRQGYEAMPTGPKAADNLLKLAMAMNTLKKDKEACIILKQVIAKFGNSSNMKTRAEQEMVAVGCGN